ncbi:hypothetical protein Hanom_Chr14g01310681 [Helianthus anomalus]
MFRLAVDASFLSDSNPTILENGVLKLCIDLGVAESNLTSSVDSLKAESGNSNLSNEDLPTQLPNNESPTISAFTSVESQAHSSIRGNLCSNVLDIPATSEVPIYESCGNPIIYSKRRNLNLQSN